jgi:hypothetical protein
MNAKRAPHSRALFLFDFAQPPIGQIVKAAAKIISAAKAASCGKNCGLFAAISQTNSLFSPCQQRRPSDMPRKSLFININFAFRRTLEGPPPDLSKCVPFQGFPQSLVNAL